MLNFTPRDAIATMLWLQLSITRILSGDDRCGQTIGPTGNRLLTSDGAAIAPVLAIHSETMRACVDTVVNK